MAEEMREKDEALMKENLAARIQKEYEEGLSYKKKMRFFTKWAEHERFKAGDQWPPATAKTKALPRPVLNIIKQIINHKVASVMNENIKMIFTAHDAIEQEENGRETQAADLFSKLAEQTWERVKQDSLNEEALEVGATTGLGIWHYYWDYSRSGGNSLKFMGDIGGETIDPVNFFPGNPQQTNVQLQPYVIITYRELAKTVKGIAERNGVSKVDIDKIKPDNEVQDQAYDMAKTELTDETKVTVLTKYYRGDDGMIYFTKVCCSVVIQEEISTGLRMYPIAIMQWDRRKQSIFGSSDVEGLIPNQKSVNFLLAMQMLSIQNTGWPKLIVDRNRVRQQLTNMPGEIIAVDGDQSSILNAVQYLNPASLSSQSFSLLDNLIQLTKDTSGTNQSSLGEQQSSQLNASAIMLLQKAASVPLESIKRRFYQAVEDIGLIWCEFWKSKMVTDRVVVNYDEEGNPEQSILNPSMFADVDFGLKIDIGPSSNYSETLMMTSLDKLFDMGQITLDDYLTLAPKNVIPFKDTLLNRIRERMEMQDEQTFQNILMQLPPEEQMAFQSAPPEQQQMMKEQLLQSTGMKAQPGGGPMVGSPGGGGGGGSVMPTERPPRKLKVE